MDTPTPSGAYGHTRSSRNDFTDECGSDTKKNELKPWQVQEWCIPSVSAEFVAAMENVMDLYAQPYDAKRPGVCIDETVKEVVKRVRPDLPMQAQRPRREDCEYAR